MLQRKGEGVNLLPGVKESLGTTNPGQAQFQKALPQNKGKLKSNVVLQWRIVKMFHSSEYLSVTRTRKQRSTVFLK